MTMGDGLLIRNVEVEGAPGLDVRLENGRITAVGPRLSGSGAEFDGRGGALIPGLIDHHVHLLGAAALADSLQLDAVRGAADLAARFASALAARPPGGWLRATGYHEHMAGLLTRDDLDVIAPGHPVRVQHRSGMVWMLNSAAMGMIGGGDLPDCVERDATGRPTGRIWRGDAWLRGRLRDAPPPLAPIGRKLAACGVIGVTDASASNDGEAITLLNAAAESGGLPQRIMMMSAGQIQPPETGAVRLGPLKILLDENDLPDFDEMVARIEVARTWSRCVAVHCVGSAELALTLAAFAEAGSMPGDRIEHGGLISDAGVAVIAELGLTVVTQPGFIFERGDRYLAEVAADDHQNLYRCASLLRAGVPVAASSDAPYSDLDPWTGIRAAASRRTKDGEFVAAAERVASPTALSLYLGDFELPGAGPRRVAVGAAADLCLLTVRLRDALESPDAALVSATIVDGRIVFEAASIPALRS